MKTREEDAAFGCVGMLSRDEDVFNHGLTKRELFAAMAMQGMQGNTNYKWKPKAMAEDAVKYADALINEQNKQNDE